MVQKILKDKPTKIFVGFSAFFVANALVAEAIGMKLFSLEKVFELQPANFTFSVKAALHSRLPAA